MSTVTIPSTSRTYKTSDGPVVEEVADPVTLDLYHDCIFITQEDGAPNREEHIIHLLEPQIRQLHAHLAAWIFEREKERKTP